MVGMIFTAMDIFLGGVGIVTLALGAVGIINIMLVTVTRADEGDWAAEGAGSDESEHSVSVLS